MEDVQQYVPTRTTREEYCTLGDDEPIKVTVDMFHHILFGMQGTSSKHSAIHFSHTGGDQMTAARGEEVSGFGPTQRGGETDLTAYSQLWKIGMLGVKQSK